MSRFAKLAIPLLAFVLIFPPYLKGGRYYLVLPLVIILIGLLFLQYLRQGLSRQRRGPKLKVHYFLLLFIVIAALNLIASVSFYQSFTFFLQLLSGVLLFWIVAFSYFSKQEQKILIIVLVVNTFLLALLGVYFYLHGHYHRLTSTFYMPNPFAGYLLLILPLAFVYLLKTKRKIWFVPVLGFMLAAFILTGSRGAFLSIIIPVIFLIFCYRKGIIKELPFLIASFLLAFILTWSLAAIKEQADPNQNTFLSRESAESGYGASTQVRLQLWKGALLIFRKYPFLGSGLDTFRKVYPAFQKSPKEASKYPHNFYLGLMVEGGILLALAFFSFLGLLFGRAFRDRSCFKPNYVPAFFAGTLGFILHNFVDMDMRWFANLLLFFFVLGFCYNALVRRRKKESAPQQTGRFWKAILLSLILLFIGYGLYRLITGYFYHQGESYQAQNKFKEAERYYRYSVIGNPSPDYYQSLAIILWSRSLDSSSGEVKKDAQYQEAISWARKAIANDFYEASHYHLLGSIYLTGGDLERAEEQFKLAIQYDPLNMPVYYLDLANLFWSQGKVFQAQEVANQILPYYPPEVVENRKGVILSRQGKTTGIEKVIADLRAIADAREIKK